MTKSIHLNENLKKLESIASWFDSQNEIDLEQALEKVKEADILIQESKQRFGEISNQFVEIKKRIEDKSDGIPF